LLLCFTLFLTWNSGRDIYLKTNPRFLTNVLDFNKLPIVSLNSSSFFFALRVTDYNGVFIDDKRFSSAYMLYNTWYTDFNDRKSLIVNKEIKMEPCKESDFEI